MNESLKNTLETLFFTCTTQKTSRIALFSEILLPDVETRHVKQFTKNL